MEDDGSSGDSVWDDLRAEESAIDDGEPEVPASNDRSSAEANSEGGEDARRYRVLATPEAGALRLLDRETYEPVVTASEGHDAPVADLRPGYLVEADLDWSTPEPTVESVAVARPTLYVFADEIDPVFDVAQEAWRDARAAGDSMNSRVTRNTDNEVNGVLYVFAEDDVNGVFEAFRDGARPLEPLVDRVNDNEGAAPREVFVLRPADGRFVVVTIALRKGGQFADTLRETYDRPRPPESLD